MRAYAMGVLLVLLPACTQQRTERQVPSDPPGKLIVGNWESRTRLDVKLPDGLNVMVEKWSFAADGTVHHEEGWGTGEVRELRALGRYRVSRRQKGTYKVVGEATILIQLEGEKEQEYPIRVGEYTLRMGNSDYLSASRSPPMPEFK